MTVILVLLTFIVFLAADLVLNWKKSASPALAVASPKPLPNDLVEGIPVPANLRYHPGHTWLSRERKNVLRVGMDAFAVALAGPIESIDVPKPGHWIRQGQKAIMIHRDGETIELLSPVEGEVTEVNTEAVSNPSTFSQDPYGKGWLFRVYAPDEEGPSRNLLPAALVRPWMRNAMERLYQLQPDFAGATAADGGLPVENLAAALPHLPAKQLAEEFFLS